MYLLVKISPGLYSRPVYGLIIRGIFASNAVKSRKRLSEDKYLEHILKFNCPDRSRDSAWLDYVNLSITTVNLNLFGISKDKWHSRMEGFWCILAFLPEILSHTGVFFCTTNNAYSGVVLRGRGSTSLQRLFAKTVVEYESGTLAIRKTTTPSNQPTCNQAEVLYPGELLLDYLNCIYVNKSDDASAVESLFAVYPKINRVECIEKTELF